MPSGQSTSADFIQAFHLGEEEAFEQLFREYFASLSLFAIKLISNESEAEDIVQDCFESLWKRKKSLTHIDSIKSYLYTSIRYRCINFLKKRKKNFDQESVLSKTADITPDIESLVVMAETAKELYSAIESLPPRMQEVLRLYYLEGKSYKEIGEMLNTAPGTVRNQRFKALQFIRKAIIPG